MNTPFTPAVTIVVTLKPVAVMAAPAPHKARRLKKAGQPVAAVGRIRQAWAAEFVGGAHSGVSVSGHVSRDAAIGALIRGVANTYDTADEVLDFFADLFGRDPLRTPDVQLARAIRLASMTPKRMHPGVRVDIQSAAEQATRRDGPAPQPKPDPALVEKLRLVRDQREQRERTEGGVA